MPKKKTRTRRKAARRGAGALDSRPAVDRVIGLLNLFFAAGEHGITYDRIQREFDVTRRTAQRYMNDLNEIAGLEVRNRILGNGQKSFYLGRNDWLRGLRGRPPAKEELAALNHALGLLDREGAGDYRANLENLRGKIEAALETSDADRADLEALDSGRGFVRRPGPERRVAVEVQKQLRDANLHLKQVRFAYTNSKGQTNRRTVSPYGILSGGTPKLIGRQRGAKTLLQYRLDRIADLEILHDEPIPVNEDRMVRDFKEYVENLFGSFSEDPVQVEWRFAPDAPNPEEWVFHASQEKPKKLADGTTVVRFRAGGLEDMARHVVGWWDWITVVKPKSLRRKILQMKLAGLAPLAEEFGEPALAKRLRAFARRLHSSKRT